MSYKADDVELLLPSFRPYVERLLAALEALGYPAVPRDTLRTPKEAEANASKGVGVKDSMHCYGAAVDVICATHGWSCHEHGCRFFEVLGEEAERIGLVWGGRWTRGGKGPDLPHVQAVAVKDQSRLRACKSAAERDAFIAKRVCRKRP